MRKGALSLLSFPLTRGVKIRSHNASYY
jgi:hypothetical protein